MLANLDPANGFQRPWASKRQSRLERVTLIPRRRSDQRQGLLEQRGAQNLFLNLRITKKRKHKADPFCYFAEAAALDIETIYEAIVPEVQMREGSSKEYNRLCSAQLYPIIYHITELHWVDNPEQAIAIRTPSGFAPMRNQLFRERTLIPAESVLTRSDAVFWWAIFVFEILKLTHSRCPSVSVVMEA